MDSKLRIERMDDQRYSVSAPEFDEDVEVVVVVTPEVQEWASKREYEEEAVVQAAMRYLIARQRVDELPTKLFLEDIDAAYEDFRATLVEWLDEGKAGVSADS